MKPFFSVCMPLHNRGDTIERALSSLLAQTYKDFEVVVVDCGSTDDTRERVNAFFASKEFKSRPFLYRFETRDFVPQGVEDWNEPVKLATGAYVAMLEGDDYFLPDNLKQAHAVLEKDASIGIYATGNQRRKRTLRGSITAEELLRSVYSLREVPPPSETIWVRTNQKGEPLLYNDKDYGYAPEIELYLRIALSGFRAFYASTQNVVRRVSRKPHTDWKYFADHFRSVETYQDAPGIRKADTRAGYREARENAYVQLIKEHHSNPVGCATLREQLKKREGVLFYPRLLMAYLKRGFVVTKVRLYQKIHG